MILLRYVIEVVYYGGILTSTKTILYNLKTIISPKTCLQYTIFYDLAQVCNGSRILYGDSDEYKDNCIKKRSAFVSKSIHNTAYI